jgi:acetyltransferase-like isoleucine patch superfamily enzyme
LAHGAYVDAMVRLGHHSQLRTGTRVTGPVTTEDHVVFCEHSVVSGAVDIGRMTWLGVGSVIVNATGPQTRISVGRYCSFGPHVVIFGNTHRLDLAATGFIVEAEANFSWPDCRGATVIGHDVWVGAHAFIAAGTTIGHGAVIGANAVVTKDVAPYTIVGGVPARILGHRCGDAERSRLLESEWWNWSPAELKMNGEFFTRPLNDARGRRGPSGGQS